MAVFVCLTAVFLAVMLRKEPVSPGALAWWGSSDAEIRPSNVRGGRQWIKEPLVSKGKRLRGPARIEVTVREAPRHTELGGCAR